MGRVCGAISKVWRLRSLTISSNKLGETSAVRLSEVWRERSDWRLCKLKLFNTDIGEKGAISLSLSLPHLQCLSSLSLDSNGIGDQGALALSLSLPHLPHLVTLSLSNNNISQQGGVSLAASLLSCLSLSELQLSHNPLGDEFVFALSTAMSHPSTHLVHIAIRQVGMTQTGALSLANAIRESSFLASLGIGEQDGGIGVDGCLALLDAASSSSTLLEVLSLRDRRCGQDAYRSMSSAVEENRERACELVVSLLEGKCSVEEALSAPWYWHDTALLHKLTPLPSGYSPFCAALRLGLTDIVRAVLQKFPCRYEDPSLPFTAVFTPHPQLELVAATDECGMEIEESEGEGEGDGVGEDSGYKE